MHVDYLNVSVPETVSAHVVDEVKEILDYVGCRRRTNEITEVGTSGTVSIRNRLGYTLVGLSGDALATLRLKDMYASLLWVFAARPHRVTSLDIAHDLSVDAPNVLDRLFRKGRGATGINLTRKRIPKGNVTRYTRDCLYRDGVTGTVYLGRRQSEVHAKVYDKRNEIMERTGTDVGYPLTRYELTVTSKMGVSLKDVTEPEPLFWHFMAGVLRPPKGVPNWVAGGQGYTMPKRKEVMPAERLKQIVGGSPELERWLKYADQAGPNGREYLLGLLRRRIMTPDQPPGSLPGAVGDQGDTEPGLDGLTPNQP